MSPTGKTRLGASWRQTQAAGVPRYCAEEVSTMIRSQHLTFSAQPLLKGLRRLSTGSLIVAAVAFCALDLQGYALAWAGEVTANINSPGPTIPAKFVGFSDEVSDVIADTIFTPGNASLINLLKLLGPNGVWRIGGGDSDLNPSPALSQQ